jgi:hypothetical protein
MQEQFLLQPANPGFPEKNHASAEACFPGGADSQRKIVAVPSYESV